MGKTPGANPNHETDPAGTDQNQHDNPTNTDPGDQGGQSGGQDDELAAFSDPVKAVAEIKKLRAENARRRNESKSQAEKLTALEATLGKLKSAFGGEDDEEVDPEVAITQLQQRNDQLEVERGITELAFEHGISKDEREYFGFLLSKRLEALEEGDEMSDEDLTEIVQKVKRTGAGAKGGSTGLPNGKGNGNPNPSSTQAVTAQEFAKMNTAEKSELFRTDRAAYDRLHGEAKEKRLL